MDKTVWATRGGLARILGVSRSTVSSWKTRHKDFPQPIGRFYNIDKIEQWRAERDKESNTV